MNAIVKCKLRFAPPPGLAGAKTIVILPLPHPQQLPDWIKKAAGYEAAVSGNNPAIVEVELKKPAPKEFVEVKRASEGTPATQPGEGSSEDSAEGQGTSDGDDKSKEKAQRSKK